MKKGLGPILKFIIVIYAVIFLPRITMVKDFNAKDDCKKNLFKLACNENKTMKVSVVADRFGLTPVGQKSLDLLQKAGFEIKKIYLVDTEKPCAGVGGLVQNKTQNVPVKQVQKLQSVLRDPDFKFIDILVYDIPQEEQTRQFNAFSKKVSRAKKELIILKQPKMHTCELANILVLSSQCDKINA